MSRRLLALVVTVTVTVTVSAAALSFATSVSAASALTRPPEVVAWWSATQVHPALPVVAPPDVGPRDLYVAGANAVPSTVAGFGPTGPVAVAGLRFRLPPGSAATQLALRLSGQHPPAVTVTACRALRPFTQVYGGAWADVPPYDCTEAGTARLTADGRLVLDGVDRLRRGRELDVVLVPGPLDRVVLAAPDARTLTVTNPPTTPTAPAANSPAYVGQPVMSGPPVAPPLAPTGGRTLGGPISPPANPPFVAAVPPVSAVPPALAGARARIATATATATDRPWPALLATLLLAVGAFASLVRPTSRSGAGTVGTRGVGRLRSERSGSVPDLT
jgi:hypothetical protein